MKSTPEDLDAGIEPDDAARVHIEGIKETCREKIAYHTAQFEKLSMMASQHKYAAQQYSILATAGDPVPEGNHTGIGGGGRI